CYVSCFLFDGYGAHLDLHSFPTRRSSDLGGRRAGRAAAGRARGLAGHQGLPADPRRPAGGAGLAVGASRAAAAAAPGGAAGVLRAPARPRRPAGRGRGPPPVVRRDARAARGRAGRPGRRGDVAQRRHGRRVGPGLLPGRAGRGRRHRRPPRRRGGAAAGRPGGRRRAGGARGGGPAGRGRRLTPRVGRRRRGWRTRTCVRRLGGVGFNNPDVPWRELERALSGRRPADDPRRWWTQGGTRRRPRPDDVPEGADGGDSPAWSYRRPPYEPPPGLRRRPATTPYAELHCHSNFSFLDGASHPEELAEEAARLGLEALALTDHDGFHGVVRFAEAARAVGLPTVFGAE